MSILYVAAPGRAIPGGWPEAGRAIDDTSLMHRRFVKDGDLIEFTPELKDETPAPPAGKKDKTDGQ